MKKISLVIALVLLVFAFCTACSPDKEAKTYTVYFVMTNITVSGDSIDTAIDGKDFSVTLTVADGCKLNKEKSGVKIGDNEDIPHSFDPKTGAFTIKSKYITDDIYITGVAEPSQD